MHQGGSESHLQNITWAVHLLKLDKHNLCTYNIVTHIVRRAEMRDGQQIVKGPGIWVCVGFLWPL